MYIFTVPVRTQIHLLLMYYSVLYIEMTGETSRTN